MSFTFAEKVGYLGRVVKYGLNIPMGEGKTHILCAIMPKSGSTFLSDTLARMPGFVKIGLSYGYDRREQELSEERLLRYHCWNYVAQQAVRYSEPTKELIEKFHLKPVVLVRNIFDVVRSFKDHFVREDTGTALAYVPENILDLEEDKIFEFIVDLMIPWYINFFGTWSQCENKILVTYEELNQDSHRTFKRILEELGMDATDEAIIDCIKMASSGGTRMNKGIIGRGQSLPDVLKERIAKYCSYYKGIDFSIIGVG